MEGLPTDILYVIILKFTEVDSFKQKYENLKYVFILKRLNKRFNEILTNNEIWKRLWLKDISQHLPFNTKLTYKYVMKRLKSIEKDENAKIQIEAFAKRNNYERIKFKI